MPLLPSRSRHVTVCLLFSCGIAYLSGVMFQCKDFPEEFSQLKQGMAAAALCNHFIPHHNFHSFQFNPIQSDGKIASGGQARLHAPRAL